MLYNEREEKLFVISYLEADLLCFQQPVAAVSEYLLYFATPDRPHFSAAQQVSSANPQHPLLHPLQRWCFLHMHEAVC